MCTRGKSLYIVLDQDSSRCLSGGWWVPGCCFYVLRFGSFLRQVEKALTYEKFRAWTDPENMTKNKVQVFLPRLKLEESYDLESFLRSVGMIDAFEEAKADFSGMSAKKNVPVSKVAHKCFVEVNEEGTEAAAATAVVRNARCSRAEPRFCADHPFLFFIIHRHTNSILFCGRFCSP